MPKNINIIKSDGTETGVMEQAQAESYLVNLLNADRVANLKQSLNDVTSNKGKPTAAYIFNGYPVLHASSGNEVKCVSLFYYDDSNVHYIIAMGEHQTSTSYKLSDYGQTAGDFKKNATISL